MANLQAEIYSLVVTDKCTNHLSKTRRSQAPSMRLVLDLLPTESGPTIRSSPSGQQGRRAFIPLYEAVTQLAFGKVRKVEQDKARLHAENERIEKLIERCSKEVAADADLERFPGCLPTAPLEALIERVENAPFPSPAGAQLLLRTARRIKHQRDAHRAEIGTALAEIFEAARAGDLHLWGGHQPRITTTVGILPRDFLLRHVTIDHSLLHVGLALDQSAATLQRAIIAPSGPRSAAYYNVNINQQEFVAVFQSRFTRHAPRATDRKRDLDFKSWYQKEHLVHWLATNRVPTYKDEDDAARFRFPDLLKRRALVRQCRKTIAPPSWRTRGPRKK